MHEQCENVRAAADFCERQNTAFFNCQKSKMDMWPMHLTDVKTCLGFIGGVEKTVQNCKKYKKASKACKTRG